MGLFARARRPSASRIAEGGPALEAPDVAGAGAAKYSPSSHTGGTASNSKAKTDANTKKPVSESLELFGADSDDSDDDATIDRYANVDSDALDDEQVLALESKKVSTLLAKMSPEELFRKYDADGSGAISVHEFLAMLPDLGIKMTDAKAMRIFRKCDTDGGGAIDLNEFKMAMFAVDPVSGNTLGFAPSSLLSPQDAFELFDADGTGQIDELEFADVLAYYGLDVSDVKQETLFRKYDKDRSGSIDYREFRAMWLRLANVRDELAKRGVEAPKYATSWKLQQMLADVLDAEEAREARVLAEAQQFLYKQREKERRVQLGARAVVRAQDELAAALDAAGQVYIFGSGRSGQFAGEPRVYDDALFPGFATVHNIWADRVQPKGVEAALTQPRDSKATKAQQTRTSKKQSSTQPRGGIDERAVQKAKRLRLRVARKPRVRDTSKFVRRRPENEHWRFESPPKLNRQSLQALNKHRGGRTSQENEREGDVAVARSSGNAANRADSDATDDSDRESVQSLHGDKDDGGNEDDGLKTEAFAQLFFEDRAFVRSLRFRCAEVMPNTGLLWARGVVHATISENVAFAVTGEGAVLTWGGKSSSTASWALAAKASVAMDFDDDDAGDGDAVTQQQSDVVAYNSSSEDVVSKVTARSAMQKMATPQQLRGIKDPDVEAREEELVAEQLREQEDDARYDLLKRVVMYYGVWELPPSAATRFLFLDQVLVPRLDFETMQRSARLRGVDADRITKMDLVLLLGECFALEVEVAGVEGHEAFRQHEERIKARASLHCCMLSLDKRSKLLQPETDKMRESWRELLALRESRIADVAAQKAQKQVDAIERAGRVFALQAARRNVQLEDRTPEYTTRGENLRIALSGITSRGPPLHSPRGRVAVASVAAGGSHVALLLHDGSVFTWGNGASGRLGLPPNDRGARCVDSDHPQRIEALANVHVRAIACGFAHSAAISADGALYAWGSAVAGQLGVGAVADAFEQFAAVPVVVAFPGRRRIRSVSCGAAHSGAVTTAGELFMWGCANGGRLGLGANVTDTVVVPTLVRSLATRDGVRVAQVACGATHSAVCTEVSSDIAGGTKQLRGGRVFVCGSAAALGRWLSVWTPVTALDDVAIQQVACGASHTAAVSALGELYTWGRNASGCTGHAVTRRFVPEPTLLSCLHVEPYNLARGRPCRQISVYNEQGPELAVNGDVSGTLATCIHTQLEDKPWWQVDLGQPAVIERIRVWNRSDVPLNPQKPRDEFTSRLMPFWVLVSEFAFQDLAGKEGLRAAKTQSSAFEQFSADARMTEWVLPTASTIGQHVRVQLQRRNFLHVAQVEVFGTYAAFQTVGRVGAVHCTHDATLVVVPPTSHASVLEDYYLRAVQADADNATVLRQFAAYERAYSTFGRGDALVRSGPCRLCRVFRPCEVCELHAQTSLASELLNDSGALPQRLGGGRMGLQELIAVIVDEDQLEAEAQKKLQQQEEAAQREAAEREAAKRVAEENAPRHGLLAAALQRPPAVLSKLALLPFRKTKPPAAASK